MRQSGQKWRETTRSERDATAATLPQNSQNSLYKIRHTRGKGVVGSNEMLRSWTWAVALVLALLAPAMGAGCRLVNNCNEPAMVCYESYGNCVCVNGSCLCDGVCGPAWWLILIFCLIILLAVAQLVFVLRRWCGWCGGRKRYVLVP